MFRELASASESRWITTGAAQQTRSSPVTKSFSWSQPNEEQLKWSGHPRFLKDTIQSRSIYEINKDVQIVFFTARFELSTRQACSNPRSFWMTSWKWQLELDFWDAWVFCGCTRLCCGVTAFRKFKCSGSRKTSRGWLIYLLKLIKRAGQIIAQIYVVFKHLNWVLITCLMCKSFRERTVDCDWGRRQMGYSSILRLCCTNCQHRLRTTSLAPEASIILYFFFF